MKTSFSRNGEARPSAAISIIIFVGAVSLMAYLRLVLFREQLVALTYGLPLLLCLWHKDRRLLWAMAAAFSVMATVKAVWLLPDPNPDDYVELLQWAMQVTNIVVIGAVIHAVLNLTERLRAKQAQLEAANEELSARQEEISRQNEELQSQTEELAWQNEELQQQSEEFNRQNEELQQTSEELEQQSEELQSQAEELQVANRELSEREDMLQTILSALRDASGERAILQQICQGLVQLVGEDAAAGAVIERIQDRLAVRVHAGAEPLRQNDWPFENSFASLVMAEGRTAFVEDLTARPDLLVPESTGGQFRSVLATPLRAHDKAMGAVELYSLQPRQWTKRQFQMIEWAAAQCALVIEMIQLQQKLRESEKQFRTLADSIPNLAWWANCDGYITWYNRRWYEYTGTTPEQMEGWGWQRVHDPEMLPKVVNQWKASLATGQSFEMEFPLRGADGCFRWFLTRVVPLRDNTGSIVRWFGTNTDVSQTREAREVLSRNKAELERLVAERTARLTEMVSELQQVSYAMVHDMRAPLRGMAGFAETLAEGVSDGLDSAQAKEYCSRIITGANRLDKLITDALNYTKAVLMELPMQPVPLAPLVRGMLETYPNLHPDKTDISIEGELPTVLGNES
ncbi:MAG TPA: PAS domain-containing protein, partial [Clostridia bacterium]|nr:PAS domain-containing protein [Clostridia bacterium]